MWARIFPAVRSEPSGLNDAKLAGASRTALPPRYATVATVWRRNARVESMSSHPELAQVMIHVAVREHAPGAPRQTAECWVLRPARVGRMRSESIDQLPQRREIVGPGVRRRGDRQFRRRRRVLRKRGDIDDQLFQRRVADGEA